MFEKDFFFQFKDKRKSFSFFLNTQLGKCSITMYKMERNVQYKRFNIQIPLLITFRN